jgi:DNA-binding transcriptional regulator YdaS (Cro superfamily)
MKLSEWLSEVRGRAAALAVHLDIKPPQVSDWCTGKTTVPFDRCVAIEIFTNRQVTCEELRPDKVEEFAYLRSTAAPSVQGKVSDTSNTAERNPGAGDLERAMAEAAKAGLVERRHHVRRAEDRLARPGGKYREHGV